MGCFQTFVQKMNENAFNLAFTMTSKSNQIEFLDVYIHKDDTGMITSSLYRKPTSGNGILHPSSFHPKNLIPSIPFGQYLRVRRNCFNESTFKREADNLRTRLIARGYSNKCLKKAFKKATSQTRQQLLYGVKSPKSDDNQIRIITCFSNQQELFKKIVHKYWRVLALDPIV